MASRFINITINAIDSIKFIFVIVLIMLQQIHNHKDVAKAFILDFLMIKSIHISAINFILKIFNFIQSINEIILFGRELQLN